MQITLLCFCSLLSFVTFQRVAKASLIFVSKEIFIVGFQVKMTRVIIPASFLLNREIGKMPF